MATAHTAHTAFVSRNFGMPLSLKRHFVICPIMRNLSVIDQLVSEARWPCVRSCSCVCCVGMRGCAGANRRRGRTAPRRRPTRARCRCVPTARSSTACPSWSRATAPSAQSSSTTSSWAGAAPPASSIYREVRALNLNVSLIIW